MPKFTNTQSARIADVAEDADVARAHEEYKRARADLAKSRQALDGTLGPLGRTREDDPQWPVVRASHVRALTRVDVGKTRLDLAREQVNLAAEIARVGRREAEAQRLSGTTLRTHSPATGEARASIPVREVPMALPSAARSHASDPGASLAAIVDRSTAALGPGVDIRFVEAAAPDGQVAAVYARDGWAATVTAEGTTAGRVLVSIAVTEPPCEGDSTTAGIRTSAHVTKPWKVTPDATGLPENPLTMNVLTLDLDRAARALALAAATVRAPAGINEWYETGVIGDPTDWTVDRFAEAGPAETLRAALAS